ncbi:MAG TPA: GNAT family N-acetyltransferase, partial [Chitinispirillaceae bacterium]|nr:GNAT family N-acetyltransferase [Chitinispirillaceae bacterium]
TYSRSEECCKGASGFTPCIYLKNLDVVKKSAECSSLLMTTLRAIEPKDIVPLAVTLPKGFQNTTKETWLQRFENWWTLNPAFTSEFPRGWILEEEAEIVGFIGNIPVKFVIHGEMKIAAASASWYVDPSIRGLASMRLFNEYLKQSDVALFLFKTEDRNLAKVVRKYGFKEYSCLSQPSEYLYIINRVQFIRQNVPNVSLLKYFHRMEINNNKNISNNGLSEPFGHIFNYIKLCIFDCTLNEIRDLSEGVYTSSLCTYCDESFTRLWDPHLKSFDVAMSRDTSTLNWLYFIAGRRYNRKVIQCHRSSDESLVGYMVFDFPPRKASGGGFMKLMDMCILNNDQQVLASLISYAIEVGKQNNAPVLRLWADSPDADRFLRKKFRIKWPAEKVSIIKFSEILEKNSDTVNIYSCMINPPRGIDH